MLLAAIAALCFAVDTLATDNSNIMLNAEASNKPREINIGIPPSDIGTVVLEDGTLSSFVDYPMYSYYHWAGGNSYSSQALMGLEQSALTIGHIGYCVNSYTRLGGERFAGAATVATSSDGRIKFDGNVSGPFGKGLYYTAGVFINEDPTSTHPKFRTFVNNMMIFKAGISWRFRRGSEISFLYKLSLDHTMPSNARYAPFKYMGNGRISAIDGFRLGRDNYLPDDDSFDYMNVATGEMHSTSLGKADNRRLHDITLRGAHRWDNGWEIEGAVHALYAGSFQTLTLTIGGISNAVSDMTLPDGQPYTGMVQSRTAKYCDSDYLDIIGDVKVRFERGSHKLLLGLSEIVLDHAYWQSTSALAHTVEVNPKRVYVGGAATWNYNTSALYYDGWSNQTAVYALYNLRPVKRLDISLGLRLALQHFDVMSAVNPKGSIVNMRRPGFNITLAELQHDTRTDFAPGATCRIVYNPFGKFDILASCIYLQYPRQMVHFFTATAPARSPIEYTLASVGFQWSCDMLNISSTVNYIRRNHLTSTQSLTRNIAGKDETISYLTDYSTATIGWTTDATFNWKGFSFHAMFTLQEPKYDKYTTGDVMFSDGSTACYDYSGMYMSKSSRFLMELDPSYKWKKLRVWASVRWYSRQYANKTNNVYFKDHWETFCGVDYNLNKYVSFSLDAINLLGQKGVKGNMDVADSITDPSLLNGYMLAGSYLIPFTVNFSIKVKF